VRNHQIDDETEEIQVLMFCGFEIELFVNKVLARDNGPTLCCARDWTARQWLILRVDQDPDHLAWVCAPVSDRAMKAVTSGKAPPRDAVQHSATGTIDLVVVDHGQAVPDRCLLCADIPEYLVPVDDRRVPCAA
jgi:hypothetical protein